MAEKRICSKCGESEEGVHFLDRCEKLELGRARKEIKRLKESVDSWKEAWYHNREIIGQLWWHHPAIDDDEKRAYYLRAQAGFRKAQKDNPEYEKGLRTSSLHYPGKKIRYEEAVFYSGFIGTEDDWHYKSWMKQTWLKKPGQ